MLTSRERAGNGGSDSEKVAQLLIDQLEVADSIVLNKLDLCSAAVAEKVDGFTRGISPGATVYRCRFGEVELHELFKNSNTLSSTVATRADVAALHVAEVRLRDVDVHGEGHGSVLNGYEESEGHGHGDGHEKRGACEDEDGLSIWGHESQPK